ncbi:hypothetical protein GSI_09691 [Ganoderma sinense ZZ0214-1]|uniref:Protein kinase domain-containing protein n=1 Tax=Ganoderma sinense ZZ0214-1 TaxID=1077348 RepID=A0A2G8S329_9APHY|nr:hypothetical protein GSI_09691 [Ganoderma sinense ZZ0214-1]
MLTSEPSLGVDSARAESPAEPSVLLEPSVLRRQYTGDWAHGTNSSQLPADLKTWRGPLGKDRDFEPAEAIWKILRPFFAKRGYTLWQHEWFFMTTASGNDAVANGYMYASVFRDSNEMAGGIQGVLSFQYNNALTRAARASDGRDVVFRVLAIGKEGREHVDLLKKFGRGSYSLIGSNHILPLLDMIDLDGITFGVFPKVAYSCSDLYHGWAESSVGDILDMIAQCLEALVFLHHCGVAHRDAFKDNFVIQWVPESLSIDYDAPTSRPRVYMIDFELAIRFPMDSPQEERSTIPDIDSVLLSMVDPDPTTRPTAFEAMTALLDVIGTIPPVALIIEPQVEPLAPVTL